MNMRISSSTRFWGTFLPCNTLHLAPIAPFHFLYTLRTKLPVLPSSANMVKTTNGSAKVKSHKMFAGLIRAYVRSGNLLNISQGIEESKTLFALDLKIRSFSVFGKHPSIVVNSNYSYNTFSWSDSFESPFMSRNLIFCVSRSRGDSS